MRTVESDLTALRHLDELLEQAAWHLDDLNDTRGDLSDADASGIAAWQEYLNRLGRGIHAAVLSDAGRTINLAGNGGGDLPAG